MLGNFWQIIDCMQKFSTLIKLIDTNLCGVTVLRKKSIENYKRKYWGKKKKKLFYSIIWRGQDQFVFLKRSRGLVYSIQVTLIKCYVTVANRGRQIKFCFRGARFWVLLLITFLIRLRKMDYFICVYSIYTYFEGLNFSSNNYLST